jgi:prefoldin subunit 5
MAEVTGAQLERNVQTLRLIRFRNYLNYLVAFIEAYAWASFGTGLAQILFIIWAISMVFVRSYLLDVQEKSIRQNNFKLSNDSSNLLALVFGLTFASLFAAYLEQMEISEQARLAESAPIRLASNKLSALNAEIAQINISPSEITEYKLKFKKLKDEKNKWSVILGDSTSPEFFWERVHDNGLKYSRIVDMDTLLTKKYLGGHLTTAAEFVKTELNTIKGKIANLESQIDNLRPSLAEAERKKDLQAKIWSLEQEILEFQTQNGSKSIDDSHHPVFVVFSDLTLGYLPPSFFVGAWGFLAIFLCMKSISVLTQGIIIMPMPTPNTPNTSHTEASKKGGIIETIIEKVIPKTKKVNQETQPTTACSSVDFGFIPQTPAQQHEQTTGYIDFGFIPKSKPKSASSQKKEQVFRLLGKGWTPKQIEKEKICSLSTIYKYRKEWRKQRMEEN